MLKLIVVAQLLVGRYAAPESLGTFGLQVNSVATTVSVVSPKLVGMFGEMASSKYYVCHYYVFSDSTITMRDKDLQETECAAKYITHTNTRAGYRKRLANDICMPIDLYDSPPGYGTAKADTSCFNVMGRTWVSEWKYNIPCETAVYPTPACMIGTERYPIMFKTGIYKP